jgi:hypothetical protein
VRFANLPALEGATGKFMLQQMAAIAELEAGMISARTKANQGVDTRSLQHYLGHKNIQHTVRYTELSPDRFRSFWKD